MVADLRAEFDSLFMIDDEPLDYEIVKRHWTTPPFIDLIPITEDPTQGKPMAIQICIPSSVSKSNSTLFLEIHQVPLARGPCHKASLQEVSSRSRAPLDHTARRIEWNAKQGYTRQMLWIGDSIFARAVIPTSSDHPCDRKADSSISDTMCNTQTTTTSDENRIFQSSCT